MGQPTACPVCSRPLSTPRSLGNHFRHRREAGDTQHIAYDVAQEDARWASLTEGADYVRCLECGHRTVTLARHLKGEHGITADEYRAKHGVGTPIRCDVLKAKRSEAISHRPITKGEKKSVVCPECGGTWEGSKYLGTVHDLRCPACWEQKWAGKSEPEDYVTCRGCGYRAENLTSHIQNSHPDLVGRYQEAHPGAKVMALKSAIRVKATLRGQARSVGFRLRVSRGKLNAGFNHTAESKQRMSVAQLLVGRIVRVSMASLAPFRLMNGKVILGLAAVGLGRCVGVIRRECLRHGLAYHNMLVSQEQCLGLIEKILGEPYQREWSSDRYVNPASGRRFKFDGCFEGCKLLVEFQGYQHRIFPNRYHVSREDFDDLQWRDSEKARQVGSIGEYRLLVIHDNEPWRDEIHLRSRLGVSSSG